MREILQVLYTQTAPVVGHTGFGTAICMPQKPRLPHWVSLRAKRLSMMPGDIGLRWVC